MKVIRRKDAKTQGLKKYFTGKPCKHGHTAEIFVTGRCVECQRSYDNTPMRRERTGKWSKDNPVKVRANSSKWRRNNTDKVNEYEAQRRIRKSQRVPVWADRTITKSFYTESQRLTKETGIPHEVDHVIPLKGKLVSGLHVPENLQIILMTDNILKGNRFTPYTYYAVNHFVMKPKPKRDITSVKDNKEQEEETITQ